MTEDEAREELLAKIRLLGLKIFPMPIEEGPAASYVVIAPQGSRFVWSKSMRMYLGQNWRVVLGKFDLGIEPTPEDAL
jgi:hypothetical protein